MIVMRQLEVAQVEEVGTGMQEVGNRRRYERVNRPAAGNVDIEHR